MTGTERQFTFKCYNVTQNEIKEIHCDDIQEGMSSYILRFKQPEDRDKSIQIFISEHMQVLEIVTNWGTEVFHETLENERVKNHQRYMGKLQDNMNYESSNTGDNRDVA